MRHTHFIFIYFPDNLKYNKYNNPILDIFMIRNSYLVDLFDNQYNQTPSYF